VLLEIAERLALKQDIRRRNISEEEIIDRTHRPMVQEGRQILTEGIAKRSSDIEVIWTHGNGFPKDLGGPMFWSGE
jgi:3-hydroxyacyl-CoA dehydrogenase